MGEHLEEHFAILRPVGSRSQDVTLVAFDHAEDGFNLPALSVCAAVKSLLHESAILASKRFGGRSAVLGRNRTADVVPFARKAMIGFAVIAGISENVLDGISVDRRSHGFLELVNVGRGAACCDRREDQVIAAVADNSQLGPASIMRVFVDLKLFGASSANEIATDVSGFQAGGIDRRQGDLLAIAKGLDAVVQKLVGHTKTQQPFGGFLQGCEVRHVDKTERFA